MKIGEVELYIRAGIEAAKWGVTSDTKIMHTRCRAVVFPGPSMEAIKVELVPVRTPEGGEVLLGYCQEADVLIVRIYEG